MLLIAWFLYAKLHHVLMSKVIVALAALVLISGLFLPRVFNAIERGGRRLGFWVGTGLTWILLVPFFYVVFVPGRA
ncbi:MAG: hypothetical protein GWM87_08275, partial [Xanthomonadales bacterium]|nr:hypothetical protein [Xanthomonadales bacterium]NIX12927.1 hypothetical protein [Xanthomonadales bacterium]